MNYYTLMPSPIDDLLLISDGRALTGLYTDLERGPAVPESWVRDDAHPVLKEARGQLGAYFAGELRDFRLPLDMAGTEFQTMVWHGLQEIPYGETISYGEFARRLGVPTASRAVGMANGKNPISIVVPCHRVIGANGKLVGYGGGLHRKQALLELEARASGRSLCL